jgi:hypothetical protein
MHTGTNPPQEFTHVEWVTLRDHLYATKQHKGSNAHCKRLYEIAMAMNNIQHMYNVSFTDVGIKGRWAAEAVAELLKHNDFPPRSMLGSMIQQLKAEGIDQRVITQLSALSALSAKAGHRGSQAFTATDCPRVAHAVFKLATHALEQSTANNWIPQAPPAAPTPGTGISLSDRVAAVEAEILGAAATTGTGTGTLIARVSALELDLCGEQKTGRLAARVAHLEAEAGMEEAGIAAQLGGMIVSSDGRGMFNFGNGNGMAGIISHTSHLTSHISHLISHISYLISHISHLTSYISHLTSHISHLTSYISHLISHISHLISHISYLISHISYLISHISYLISHIYGTLYLHVLIVHVTLYYSWLLMPLAAGCCVMCDGPCQWWAGDIYIVVHLGISTCSSTHVHVYLQLCVYRYSCSCSYYVLRVSMSS